MNEKPKRRNTLAMQDRQREGNSMTRKKPEPKASAANTMRVQAKPDEPREVTMAKLAVEPTMTAALVSTAFAKGFLISADPQLTSLVIPGPAPDSSALEPGIQLLAEERKAGFRVLSANRADSPGMTMFERDRSTPSS